MQSSTVSPILLTRRQVCERLGISEGTLKNIRRDNDFPEPKMIGRSPRWLTTKVDRWAEGVFTDGGGITEQ